MTTSPTARATGLLAAVAVEVGLTVQQPQRQPGDTHRPDLIIDVDGHTTPIDIKSVAYCTGDRARGLVARRRSARSGLPLVVADRITADAKDVLKAAGWSWFDRRGQLHIHAPGIRIDTAVARREDGPNREPKAGIVGSGGLAVAYWLCAHRGQVPSPTRHSGPLGVAPSTVTAATQHLAAAGLLNDGGGVFPDLFWELASTWRPQATWMAQAPEPDRRWCLTGSRAAAALGAPVATGDAGPLEIYVAGPIDADIAVRRLGSARPGAGACVALVPPTRASIDDSAPGKTAQVAGWRVAPRLTVALDLAQDAGRGSEILDEWRTSDDVW
ncbi:MAG: hypothetical protein H0U92_12995 [Actinobacteria bacterium]|nr:hypothetical protein [Actinomycetota bacterium]